MSHRLANRLCLVKTLATHKNNYVYSCTRSTHLMSSVVRLSLRGRLLPSSQCLLYRRWISEESPQQLPKRQKPLKSSPVSWKALAVTAGLGAIFVGGMLYVKYEKDLVREKQRTKYLGKADIGGPWELVDHNGKAASSADFLGQWLLLYFGFTHCPDICPDELEKIVAVVDKIDATRNVPNVIPLFISIDPQRDTVAAVSEYIKEFSPKMIGLTGSDEQVAKAAKAFRVYFTQGPKDEDNDYIVDHSIVTYLINPDGDFVDYYGQNQDIDQCVGSIRAHMLKYRQTSQ